MFKGRIDRVGYLLGYLFATVPIFLFIGIYFIILSLTKTLPKEVLSGISIILYIPTITWVILYTPVTFGLFVRRLHDINQSGYWTALLFLPVVGNIASLAAFFLRGNEGPNEYGERLSPRNFDRVIFGAHPKDAMPQPVAARPLQQKPDQETTTT